MFQAVKEYRCGQPYPTNLKSNWVCLKIGYCTRSFAWSIGQSSFSFIFPIEVAILRNHFQTDRPNWVHRGFQPLASCMSGCQTMYSGYTCAAEGLHWLAATTMIMAFDQTYTHTHTNIYIYIYLYIYVYRSNHKCTQIHNTHTYVYIYIYVHYVCLCIDLFISKAIWGCSWGLRSCQGRKSTNGGRSLELDN